RSAGSNSEGWDLTDNDGHDVADGSYTYKINAADAATNAADEQTGTIVVDRSNPANPTITSPADGSYSTNGDVTLSGQAEAGATVKVYDGTTLKDHTSADATTGAWTLELATEADGAHSYSATATDEATNTSAASDAVGVTVDTVVPHSSASSAAVS